MNQSKSVINVGSKSNFFFKIFNKIKKSHNEKRIAKHQEWKSRINELEKQYHDESRKKELGKYEIEISKDDWQIFEENVSYDNFNIVISGSAGVGKTILIKEMVLRLINENNKVFIIDDCRDFKDFSNYPNSQIIKIDDGCNINPFSLIVDNKINQESAVLMFVSIISNIYKPVHFEKHWNELKKCISATKEEKNIIELAVRKTIKDYGSSGTFELLSNNLIDSSLNLSKEEQSITKAIKESLDNFLSKNSQYFTRSIEFNKSSSLIIFDIAAPQIVEDNLLQTSLVITLMNLVENFIIEKNSNQKSFLVIDDIRYGTRYVAATNYLLGLSRKLKNHNAGIIVSVQAASDFYQNDKAKAIFEESAQKIFLRQRVENYNDLVDKKLELSEIALSDIHYGVKRTNNGNEGLLNLNGKWYLKNFDLSKVLEHRKYEISLSRERINNLQNYN